jgi:hypothetical protein
MKTSPLHQLSGAYNRCRAVGSHVLAARSIIVSRQHPWRPSYERRSRSGPLAQTAETRAAAANLAERLTLARAQQLDYVAFLTLLLADEVQRRDQQALERHLVQAGFEDRVTLDGFDWTSPVQLDRRQLQQVFSLEFLARKEHVVFVGPVGVGKTMLAQSLGSASVRAGLQVIPLGNVETVIVASPRHAVAGDAINLARTASANADAPLPPSCRHLPFYESGAAGRLQTVVAKRRSAQNGCGCGR